MERREKRVGGDFEKRMVRNVDIQTRGMYLRNATLQGTYLAQEEELNL